MRLIVLFLVFFILPVAYAWDFPITAIWEPPNFEQNNNTVDNGFQMFNSTCSSKYGGDGVSGKFSDTINCSTASSGTQRYILNDTAIGCASSANCSLDFWFKPEDANLARYVLEWQKPGTGQYSFTGDNGVGGAGYDFCSADTNFTPTAGTWYHLSVILDIGNSKGYLWVNCQLNSTVTCNTANGNPQKLVIGRTNRTATEAENIHASYGRIVYIEGKAINASVCTNLSYPPLVVRDTLNLSLNGLNATRDYEVGSNITLAVGSNCSTNPNITINNKGYPETFSGTSWIYNLTRQLIGEFDGGLVAENFSASNRLSYSIDNRSTMVNLTLNVTGFAVSGAYPANLSLYSGNETAKNNSDITFPQGVLRGNIYSITALRYNNVWALAHNITFGRASSATVNFNVSTLNVKRVEYSNMSNFTIALSGFNTDPVAASNLTTATTTSSDRSKSSNASFGLHVNATYESQIEDFEDNGTSGNWVCSGTYDTCAFFKDSAGNCTQVDTSRDNTKDDCIKVYKSTQGTEYDLLWSGLDIRNMTYIKLNRFQELSWGNPTDPCNCDDTFSYFITDGTTSIQFYSTTMRKVNGNVCRRDGNITLSRANSTSNTWYANRTETEQCSGSQCCASQIISSPDTTPLNPNVAWNLKFESYAGGDTFIGYTVYSGIGIAKPENYSTYAASYANVTSLPVVITTDNIVRAKLNPKYYAPKATNITWYLSNDNATFKQATPGSFTVFDTSGKNLTWKATIIGNGTRSPSIFEVQTEIIPGTISNVSLDIGCDGSKESTYTGQLNSTTSPQTVNLSTEFIKGNILSNCNNTKVCNIPLCTISGSAGILQLDFFNYTHNFNPIILNYSKVEKCSNCTINLTFSGGNIQVDNFDARFRGRLNLTFNVTATGNETCNASFPVTQVARTYYSEINITQAYDYFEFFITSYVRKGNFINASNITPYGQTQTFLTNFSVTSVSFSYGNRNYSNNATDNSTNTTASNLSILDLLNITKGPISAWINFSWTDSSKNTTICNETFLLGYSNNGTEFIFLDVNNTNPYNFSGRTERYLKPQITLSTNFSVTNCSVTSITFNTNYTPAEPSTPYHNFTTLGWDWSINVSMKLNQSVLNCMNFTFSTDPNRGNATNLTENFATRILGSYNYTNKTSLWYFVDLLGCNTSAQRYVIRQPIITTCCANCTGGCT